MNRTYRADRIGLSPLRALIFDLDGTIADTEEVHRRAFNEAFEAHGLSWVWSEAKYARLLAISGGRERIMHYASCARPPLAPGTPLIELAQRLHQAKSAIYARLLAETEVPLRDGVMRLLNEARGAGIRLAIASSTSLANVRAVLDHNLPGGWAEWFEVLATSDQAEAKKPDPAVYDHVIALTGWDRGECVALEDTPNGNRAARAAGLTTVITTHAFTRDGDFGGAALVVDGLGEPDRPYRVIAGEAYGAHHVDVGLLRRIVSAARDAGRPGVACSPTARHDRAASVATSTG